MPFIILGRVLWLRSFSFLTTWSTALIGISCQYGASWHPKLKSVSNKSKQVSLQNSYLLSGDWPHLCVEFSFKILSVLRMLKSQDEIDGKEPPSYGCGSGLLCARATVDRYWLTPLLGDHFPHSDGLQGGWEWCLHDVDADGAKINLVSEEKEMLEGWKKQLKTTKEQGFEFGVEGERVWLCRE